MQSINDMAARARFMLRCSGPRRCAGADRVGDPLLGQLVALARRRLRAVPARRIRAHDGWHVPLNDTLATVHPHAAGAARAWDTHARDWTLWNHVRTVAGAAAAAAFTVALTV